MTHTKEAIISAVAEDNGYPRNKASMLIETLIGIIKSRFATGEDVLITGFETFCVHQKRERRGRNPSTGEAMMLAPRRVVRFKCSGKLRERINESQ